MNDSLPTQGQEAAIEVHIFACRYCGQGPPPEWGVGRKCPKYPHGQGPPPYMRQCEFETFGRPIEITHFPDGRRGVTVELGADQ